MNGRTFVIAAALCCLVAATLVRASVALAASPTASLEGIVRGVQQRPLEGASINVEGPSARQTASDADGRFTLDGIPPGHYTIAVNKPGFTPIQMSIAVVAGTPAVISVDLEAATVTSLQEIGRVSVSSNAGNAINTSSASIATLTGSAIINQGQLNLSKALNEIPGVVIGTPVYGLGGTNASSPIASGSPQIRGALPYETETMIDGHPVTIGYSGSFDTVVLNPYMLQDVEVVKGPGANAPNVFYSVGGTINFRTLKPTISPSTSVDYGIDQFGNMNANLRATGTRGRVGYAFDYATQGSQGPERGFAPLDPLAMLVPGDLVDGQPICQNPAVIAQCSVSSMSGPPNLYNSPTVATPLVLCCTPIPLTSNSRNELGKLRYDFSASTSLTLTYLGAQIRGSLLASQLFTWGSNFSFAPPAGYTGALAPGSLTPFTSQYDSFVGTNASVYEAEFRSAIGPLTVLAQWYVTSNTSANDQFGPSPPGNFTASGLLYGGIPLNSDTTPTIFNGTPGTVTYFNPWQGVFTSDALHGVTVQLTLPLGANVFSVSYDGFQSRSQANVQFADSAADYSAIYPGSGQSFQTIAALGQFQLAPNLDATLSNYASLYTDRYTQDFGNTFQSSTHAYDAPRLSFVWRGKQSAVRAAAGYSLAPPYLGLLTNIAPSPGDSFPLTYFVAQGNSGDISPETAFGWDLGADVRTARETTLSVDLYETLVRNQFLTTSYLAPAPIVLTANNAYGAAAGSYPVYIQQTLNLGHSRYAGIEMTLHRDPLTGFGYRLQGSLQRAYPYDLPAGIYDSGAGPNTLNLGILDGVNFQPLGLSGGFPTTGIPYAQGYAELNWRGKRGEFGLIGVTYYGSNNGYDEPPFGLVNASWTQPLGRNTDLRLAVNNLTNAYSSLAINMFGPIYVPLENGQFEQTSGNVFGPSTASLTLHVKL